jgi:hypothetical protein
MNPANLIELNRMRRRELDNELSRIHFLRNLKEAKTKNTNCSHKNKGTFSVFSLVIGMAREVIRLNSIAHDSYDKKLHVI